MTNEWYVSDIACEVTYEIVSNTDHRHIYMFMCKCMMVTNVVWLILIMENVWMYAYVINDMQSKWCMLYERYDHVIWKSMQVC